MMRSCFIKIWLVFLINMKLLSSNLLLIKTFRGIRTPLTLRTTKWYRSEFVDSRNRFVISLGNLLMHTERIGKEITD